MYSLSSNSDAGQFYNERKCEIQMREFSKLSQPWIIPKRSSGTCTYKLDHIQ